jgi:hypothetical protein
LFTLGQVILVQERRLVVLFICGQKVQAWHERL